MLQRNCQLNGLIFVAEFYLHMCGRGGLVLNLNK